MQIAADTPTSIINVLRKVDTTKLDRAKLNEWLKIGTKHIDKFVPRRQVKPQLVDVPLPGVPQEVATFLNNYEFGKVNFAYKQIARIWLENNLPMKK